MSCGFVLWFAPAAAGFYGYPSFPPDLPSHAIFPYPPYSCLKLFDPTRSPPSPGDIVFQGPILHDMDQLESIHFADGFDEKDGLPRLRKLLDSKWNISSDGKGIEKKYHFKNHTNVLDFIHYVGVKCKRKNHHPEAIMTMNSLTYKWTTHRPQGLSQKDLEMAEFCDEVARDHIPVVDEREAPGCGPASKP